MSIMSELRGKISIFAMFIKFHEIVVRDMDAIVRDQFRPLINVPPPKKKKNALMAKYKILVNSFDNQDNHNFEYVYRQMRIKIYISKSGFYITYSKGMPNEKADARKIWESYEVEDAIRKCLLTQLIFFGRNNPFESVIITTNDADPVVLDKISVYSLIPYDTEVDLRSLRDDIFVTALMNVVRTSYEEGMSALFSYIYAKSKDKEEDRFSYFWRSFNGIYNSIAIESELERDTIQDYIRSFNYGQDEDYEGIVGQEGLCLKNWLYRVENQTFTVKSLFSRYYRDKATADKNYRRFFHIISGRIAAADWTTQDVRNAMDEPGNKNMNLARLLNLDDFVNEDNNDHMNIEIEGQPFVSFTSLYGYLVTELTYRLRCDNFHAAKPILLYTTLKNPEFRILQLANALLEDYLDKNIKEEVEYKLKIMNE